MKKKSGFWILISGLMLTACGYSGSPSAMENQHILYETHPQENKYTDSYLTSHSFAGTWMLTGMYHYDEETSELALMSSWGGIYTRFSSDGTYNVFSFGESVHHFDTENALKINDEYLISVGTWSIFDGFLNISSRHVFSQEYNITIDLYILEDNYLFLISPNYPYSWRKFVKVENV